MSENVQFLDVRFSIYLNERVFIIGELETEKATRNERLTNRKKKKTETNGTSMSC